MTVTLEVPEELAAQLHGPGQDIARSALEALGVEAYRSRRITEHQLAKLLQMDRYELDGFLKRQGVWLDYSTDDLRREGEMSGRIIERHKVEGHRPNFER